MATASDYIVSSIHNKPVSKNLMYIIIMLFICSSIMAALPHVLKKKSE